MSSRVWSRCQNAEHLASDIALQAADDLGLGLALGQTSLHVGLGWPVPTQSRHHDSMKGRVGLTVTAAIQPVALGLP